MINERRGFLLGKCSLYLRAFAGGRPYLVGFATNKIAASQRSGLQPVEFWRFLIWLVKARRDSLFARRDSLFLIEVVGKEVVDGDESLGRGATAGVVCGHGSRGEGSADSATIEDTLSLAGGQVVEVTHGASQMEEAVADKGYHKAETLVRLTNVGDSRTATTSHLGLRTSIAEPDTQHHRRWTHKPREWEAAYRANRRRTRGSRGKSLQRRRREVLERSFAHVCETGGARPTWLRGLMKITKRYQLQTAAHNLGLILRHLLGPAKPRAFAACFVVLRTLKRDLPVSRRCSQMFRYQTLTKLQNPHPALAT